MGMQPKSVARSKPKTGLGGRIFAERKRKAWTLDDLSEKTGINPAELSRFENNKRYPNSENLHKLAIAFDIDVEQLTVGRRPLALPIKITENPKPVRLGKVVLRTIYILLGNHSTPFEISVLYKHDPLRIPLKVRPYYDDFVRTLHAEAKADPMKYHNYFNGPNVRLVRATEANSRQLPTGEELRGVVLHLAPVCWDEFTVLNRQIDKELFPNEGKKTIRQLYASEEKLYAKGADLSWCQLSNILTINMTPITRDGYCLIDIRSRHGVSTGAGQLANSVHENMHRYLDDSPPGDLTQRLNPIGKASEHKDVDPMYSPEGVPSPLLTAQRGMYEEIGEELYWRFRNESGRFKFLNIIMDLEYFNPHLVGIIETGLTKDEIQEITEGSIGKDHTEKAAVHYLKMDTNDPETMRIVSDLEHWSAAGLSAVITAIHYWEAKAKLKSQ